MNQKRLAQAVRQAGVRVGMGDERDADRSEARVGMGDERDAERSEERVGIGDERGAERSEDPPKQAIAQQMDVQRRLLLRRPQSQHLSQQLQRCALEKRARAPAHSEATGGAAWPLWMTFSSLKISLPPCPSFSLRPRTRKMRSSRRP